MYGGKFAFQNRLNQLVVGRRFPIFCFVLLCIRGQIPIASPPPPGGGGLYSEGRLNGGFLRYELGGLIFGGAYTWGCLFSEFYGITYQTQQGDPFFRWQDHLPSRGTFPPNKHFGSPSRVNTVKATRFSPLGTGKGVNLFPNINVR